MAAIKSIMGYPDLAAIAAKWPTMSATEKTDILAELKRRDAARQGGVSGRVNWLQTQVGFEEKDQARNDAQTAQRNNTVTAIGTAVGAPLAMAGGNALFREAPAQAIQGGQPAAQQGGQLAQSLGANPQAPAAATSATPGVIPEATAIGQNADGSMITMPGAAPAAEVAGQYGPLGELNGLETSGIGVAASLANREARRYADRYDVGTEYDATQAMNPINQAQSLQGNIGNIMGGERIDTGSQIAMALPSAGTSFLYNPLFARGGVFGSSKDKDQVQRDAYRSGLKESGLLDDNYQYTLADGSQYDMGKDGGFMLDNFGTNIDGRNQRHSYDIDFSREGAGNQATSLSALATALGANDAKSRSDMAGMFWNAANSNGATDENIMAMIDQNGGHDRVYGAVHEAAQGDKPRLSVQESDAMKAELDRIYGIENPANKKDPKKGLLGLGAKK